MYFCNVIALWSFQLLHNWQTLLNLSIKKMERILYFLLVVFSVTACTPKIQEASADYIKQATALKTETHNIQQSFKETIQNLRQQRNNIMVQGRALTEAELLFIDKVNEIISDQGELDRYLADIDKSENAYDLNGKELLYLNQQANQVAKKIQKKIQKIG